MTVKEFIKVLKKLEQNREIYVSSYDDVHGTVHYDTPKIQEDVADVTEYKGRDIFTRWVTYGKKVGEKLIYVLTD